MTSLPQGKKGKFSVMIFQVCALHAVLLCKADIYLYFLRENASIRTFLFRSLPALIKELDSNDDGPYHDSEFGYIKTDVKLLN